VSEEMSLELIPRDGVDVHMGIAVHLPLVGCCPIELVRSKKDFSHDLCIGRSRVSFQPP
jgi:hypothetical protein